MFNYGGNSIKKDRQPDTVSPLIEEISGLVVVTTWLVITATASFNLAVGTAGHRAALAVLDGDGLDFVFLLLARNNLCEHGSSLARASVHSGRLSQGQ